MQGNKKQADGQSDSSSIGSLLDDTDREVCSLTDRAFKSLCVAELGASFLESDPVLSSYIPHHFSGKLFHGPRNDVIRENADSSKRRSNAEAHSTFRPFPKEAQEDENVPASNTPNIRRKLGLPVPGSHSSKHTSKVSSLIKTFDHAEKQPSLEVVKPPVRNSLTERPLVFGGNMSLWSGKAILNIQKELSGFSDPRHDGAEALGRQGMHKRHSKMDLVCQGPYSIYFSQADTSKSHLSPLTRKAAKNKSGKGKEPSRRGSFLHSENSAFESWNAHHKKLTEDGESPETIPKGKHLTYFKEAPFLQQPSFPGHKLFPQNFTAPKILKQEISNDILQKSELSPETLGHPLVITPSKLKSTNTPIMLPHASDLPSDTYDAPSSPSLTSNGPFPPAPNPPATTSPVSLSKAPISPPLPQALVSLAATCHGPNTSTSMSEVTVLPQKANCVLENVVPPWRKQKTKLGGMELAQDMTTGVLKSRDSSYKKPSDLPSLEERTTVDSHVAFPDTSDSNFNISKLLTPVITPKQEKQLTEDKLLLINSPLSEAGMARESEERAAYSSQNNYKSKAPSLLFNLKDIRKRVKSTYSPSPLLRAAEDKKKIKELDDMKANVSAVNMPEGDSEKWLVSDERSHPPSEQMESIQDKDNASHLNSDYLTWSVPKLKEEPQHDQSRQRLGEVNSVDIRDSEMVSVTELHPDENKRSHCLLASNCYSPGMTTDPEVYAHSLPLQGPKNDKTDPSQNAHIQPQVSPNLFFTAEENIIDHESQACSMMGNEPRRSTSSSEHSFVSTLDQPEPNGSPCSLMQLFQKACLQESQRNEKHMDTNRKPRSEETEKSGKNEELDYYLLNDWDSHAEGKHERKEEGNENDHGAQGNVVKDRKEEGWKGMNTASEDRLEEPLSPTSSSSFKPNLFMIKDNTFKSSPVIKAVKLPLLRSVSCEDTMAVSHSETEKPIFGPVRATPNLHEMDRCASRIRSPHDDSSVASSSVPVTLDGQGSKKGKQTSEDTPTEGQGDFYMQELVGEDGRASVSSMLSHKDLEGREELTKAKEKAKAGKPKKSSAHQSHHGLEKDLEQNQQTSPTREKGSHLKNGVFPKRRDGSCVKKTISRETASAMASENQTSSPVPSDVFGHTLAASGQPSSSALPGPRSDSMGPSTLASPLSDTTATFTESQAEKLEDSSVPHQAVENRHALSPMETANPAEASQRSGSASHSPVLDGRQRLMGQMVKTAAKPPAVPPKTEKALRRAKKLASKRKKIEAQQKKPLEESTIHSTDVLPSPLGQSPLSSPVCPNSPLAPSESNLRLKARPLLTPTPSLPETQRKLLQDPDSGEYFIIDLPIQLKTFYDPETGRYVQVSIPPSTRDVSQVASTGVSPSPFVLYPSTLPLRVSSVPVLASPSQFSEPASFPPGALSTSDWEPGDQYLEPQGGQPSCAEPAMSDGYVPDADGTECSFDKDVSLSANADIISTGAIEDFAIEGIW